MKKNVALLSFEDKDEEASEGAAWEGPRLKSAHEAIDDARWRDRPLSASSHKQSRQRALVSTLYSVARQGKATHTQTEQADLWGGELQEPEGSATVRCLMLQSFSPELNSKVN